MVDVFLVISVVVLAPVILGLCVLLLAYFGHPDDRNEAYFPKAVTVFGLFLAIGVILTLPYDVENTKRDGSLRIDILWQILMLTITIMVVVIIPFAFFYYESDVDPEEKITCCETQLCEAIKGTMFFIVIFGFVLALMFTYLSTAILPVRRIAISSSLIVNTTSGFFNSAKVPCGPGCVSSNFDLQIPVTFPIYTMAFLSFWGWFLFSLFAGVGLVALPFDLINEFRTRPVPLAYKEYMAERTELGNRAKHLLEVGEQLSRDMDEPNPNRKLKKSIKDTMEKFEAAYYFLKTDFEVLRVSKEEKGGNPLWYFFKLILGLIGAVISATWIIHIGIFVLPRTPIDPFLNQFFIILSNVGGGGFSLFGVIAYAMYALWLLWAVIKGNFRFGARFMLFRLYPMELGNTLMNAFLFNTWLVLLCSVPAVQFCVEAFPVYARVTSIDMLFGTQSRYLPFFKYFWGTNHVFIWGLIAIAFITTLIMFVWPDDKAKAIAKKIARVERGEDP